MPQLTPKLGIKKPLGNETVSRAAFNENWDIIDQNAASQDDFDTHKTASVLDHPDGSVTDAKIGNRTISDTAAPTGDTGTPTNLWSWLAYMIKAITGKSSWRTAPATTLEAAKAHMDATTGVHGATSVATPNTIVQRDPAGRFKAAAPLEPDDVARKAEVDAKVSKTGDVITGLIEFANGKIQVGSTAGIKRFFRWDGTISEDDVTYYNLWHAGNDGAGSGLDADLLDGLDSSAFSLKSDYVRQPGYAAATGSANAYSVTLNPGPAALVEGMAVAVKIPVDNTGASTLNVNGLGAKPIKKPNGNDVAAGNLKAGSIYTLRYNASTGNFILQGEGGDFSVGDTITDVRLLPLSGGMGAEIWSKTDVANGNDIAVDSAGNVYCAHYVSSGYKAIRKLDSSGNEIWSNTDVGSGSGIAVDSAGNVYCAHYVSSGYKAIRKLDSSGNEIWSNTDVGSGSGIAVDSAGNVYCAHGVSSGGKAIRKLDSSGNEIWSKTDVANGRGVAVDSAGNVYCAHYVSSGDKAIRKLDSSGNEIWAKTDVANGRGVAVDSAGNVYCAHYVSSGDKAIRKLDSSGNEIWSKTDVENGNGIAVDSAGNVYCAHGVGSGNKAIRKLDGNRYFRII